MRVHTRDQRGEIWPCNMITDANREALAGSANCGECAIMDLQEFAGVLKEGRSPGR
ncbi:hypothetical protein D3C85_1738110 [compost metagenome]